MKRRVSRRTGFTLVEMMFAAAMLVVATMALFGGISYCARATHDTSQLLAADAYAFDVAWHQFNQGVDSLIPGTFSEEISSNAVPVLWYKGSPAWCHVTITNNPECTGFQIDVNVEWGPENHRQALVATPFIDVERGHNHPVRLYRSNLSRRLP